MELYFLRHGAAGERSEWTGDDEQRPLTDAGKAQTAAEAGGLARLGIVPDLILTSPLTRASQTAAILAQELGVAGRVVTDDRLSPGFGRKKLRKILNEYAGQDRLMLVGHEPDFSKVVGRLIGGGRVAIAKGGLACVEVSDSDTLHGKLLQIVTPETLELGTPAQPGA